MSENYGNCRRCRGTALVITGREMDGTIVTAECSACDGTGIGGNAMDGFAISTQQNREQQHREDSAAGKEWDR